MNFLGVIVGRSHLQYVGTVLELSLDSFVVAALRATKALGLGDVVPAVDSPLSLWDELLRAHASTCGQRHTHGPELGADVLGDAVNSIELFERALGPSSSQALANVLVLLVVDLIGQQASLLFPHRDLATHDLFELIFSIFLTLFFLL